LRIIENSVQIAEDLDVGCFGWGRTANTMFYNAMDPLALVHSIYASFGVRGNGRHRQFDENIPGRADVDFTLQALLEDRIVYVDRRFYFDHGGAFSGSGGSVGLIDRRMYENSTSVLQERWGRYVTVTGRTGASLMAGGAQGVQATHIKVRRRSGGVTGAKGSS
jgi:hypothetical protein